MSARWKVACINWTHADAPHALAYLWDGEFMRAERYFDNWSDAVSYATGYVAAYRRRAAA